METLQERVYQVFGNQTLEDLIDLDYVERELDVVEADDRSTRVFALRGFVSGPQVQKMNRNSIFLFVNGRLIRDRLLLHALSSAYHNLMPPACYPFALLFRRLRLRRSGRERSSLKNRSSFPARHVSCTISCATRFASA